MGSVREITPIPNVIINSINPDSRRFIHKVFDATSLKPTLYTEGPSGVFYGLPLNGKYTITANNNTELPKINQVLQGGIGDCVMDSVLAVAAEKNPNAMKNGIIKDPTLKDVYYVRLYYNIFNRQIFVRITAELPLLSDKDGAYDRFKLDSNGQAVIWAHLYAKAYVCMLNVIPDFLKSEKRLGYNALNGVDAKLAHMTIFGLTGGSNNIFFGEGNDAIKKVAKFMNNGDVYITGATSWAYLNSIEGRFDKRIKAYRNPNPADDYPDVIYIYDSKNVLEHVLLSFHSYSILGITSDNKIIVRNPWGSNTMDDSILNPSKVQKVTFRNGLMYIPIDDYIKTMHVYYSVRDKNIIN
jgi:hypothetical protein